MVVRIIHVRTPRGKTPRNTRGPGGRLHPRARCHQPGGIVVVEVLVLVGGGVLVLLVLGDEVVHVALGLGELHLVHALGGVPVEESLAAEHDSELLGDPPEHLLDGGGVAHEVNSGMVRERYCCEPLAVNGANPTMKKCSRGKGMRFTASFRREEELTAGVGELEGPEADVVEGLIVEDHALVGILDELVDGEGGVVRLHHRSRSSRPPCGPRRDGIDELSSLGVVALCPVIPGAILTENEVIWAEDLAIGACAEAIHGAGLEVKEHSAGHVAASAGLVVVDVDPLQLQVGLADVPAGGVDAVLIADHLPELAADLVAALAGLYVKDLPHRFLFLECFF
ncbi:unnamed protein product [Spirodela intermedia]|uniref:Uncharacterized protein n=1 Tax=Spirodela intermedia TaxID=51605 RepID=A0A7I8J018_SPIIN|nr:unnamed protein product [Spirodela intermedia]CAA6662650.1 unnamed protein product [Spirodela intermedia]